MNCTQAKKIKIEEYLKSKNIIPDNTRLSGTVLIYKSPYRNETKGSFEVNTNKNVWYDYGPGHGGNILDLVMKMENTDLSGSLELLASKNIKPFLFYQQETQPTQHRQTKIISIKQLTSPDLIKYVNERKICTQIAAKYLHEITYSIWISKNNEYKTYKALGFKNNNEGYELRNRYFQGCTSKYFTTINGSRCNQVNIFEGFFDFLSSIVLSSTNKLKFDSLILNSVSLIEKTKDIVNNYDKLNLFLDNDKAGEEATKYFQSIHNNVRDYSKELYLIYNDLNDYLKNQY